MRKEIYEKNGNQESSDTLPFHWEFGKEEITLKVSSYAYGNGLVVLMYSQSEGELELFGDLTVNLPGGYGLEPQEAFVSGDFTKDKLHSSKRTGWERCCRDKPVQDLPPTPRWHSTFQGLPSMTGKGWKNFADNGGWMCQKNRKKTKGNLQAKRKEKERDKNIWK